MIAELREDLKAVNIVKNRLDYKVKELEEKLDEKHRQVLSLSKRNADLERTVAELQGQGKK